MLNELNFHHLYYFWLVAREGGVQAAARKLRLAHPTVSGQVKQLEAKLGHRLLERRGRRLQPTATGELVLGYADVIFSTGHELLSALEHGPERPTRLVVGVTEVMPKLVVRQLLEPAYAADPTIRMIIEEESLESLLGKLAIHQVDLILADATIPKDLHVKAFNHALGECGLVFLATDSIRQELSGAFPACLDGAPMLLPTRGAAMRRSLESLFEEHNVKPRIAAEVADSAMLKVMGAAGRGVFAIPDIIEEDVCRQYAVQPIGRDSAYRERFYAISSERRIRHPSVLAICDAARME